MNDSSEVRLIRRSSPAFLAWRNGAAIWVVQGWRADALGLCLGALSAFALPPYNALPVLALGIPGLLRQIDAAASARAAARRGWWFGFGLNLVGLYWITEAILVEAARFWWLVPLAVPALAVVMALFVAAATAAAWYARPGPPRILVLAGAWVVADIGRQFIGTGFPWNPLGSVWELPGAIGDILIQPAAWVGIHGLTLATLLIMAAPRCGVRACIVAVIALAGWLGLGAYRLDQPTPVGSREPIHVAVIQGNVPQTAKWDQAHRVSIFERYLKLSSTAVRQTLPGERPVVIWPETSSPFLIDEDPTARLAIASAMEGSDSLIGAIRFDSAGRPRNTLFALSGTGAILGKYDKWHLVPFGEFAPSWMPLSLQVVPGGGFASGSGPEIVEVPGLPAFAPLICYEAIFSGQVTPSTGRPDWIVNITNDAWFGNSSGPRQHLAAARMRAVEEGLPLVRAANTGISAVFDGHGHEIARLEIGETGVLSAALPNALPVTIYARFGLVLPGALAVLAIVAGGVASIYSENSRPPPKSANCEPSLSKRVRNLF